jgi:prepilin-type N-terminal cleavage/methylation domain-containing protein
MAERSRSRRRVDGERGFTLVEALIAIVVLAVGLIGVTNLIVLAADSNSVANHATAAVTEATETIERLKAIPFVTLAVPIPAGGTVGDLDNPLPAPLVAGSAGADDVVVGVYNRIREVPGVGPIRTTWRITLGPASDFMFIEVRSESASPMRGRRSRAELSTFRACTTAGCPLNM